jgi:serine/threonine protein kinase
MTSGVNDVGLVVKDMVLLRLIGAGTYSRVYLAKHLNTCQNYAVKKIIRHPSSLEWNALKRLRNHRNIVQFIDTFEEHENRFLVLEYCYCNLSEYILEYSLEASQITDLYQQLVSAVIAMHETGISHRDLKPENCFLTCYGKETCLKVGDFGLCSMESMSNAYGLGSRRYMSYECYNPPFSKSIPFETRPSDIWSLGVILLNLITKKCPWERPTFSDPYFRYHIYTQCPDSFIQVFQVSHQVAKLLRRIFSLVPQVRPTAKELFFLVVSLESKYSDRA